MREIVLDTETTGLDPKSGDRLVEIGCVELDNHLPTGRTYHQYVNPERDMPEEAFRVHGLSEAFLAKHPVFADIADAFLEFIGDADLSSITPVLTWDSLMPNCKGSAAHRLKTVGRLTLCK